MRLRPIPLTGSQVDRLPGACADCVFWELGGACPQPRSTTVLGGLAPVTTPQEQLRAPRERKRDWIGARLEQSGPPGAVIEDERGQGRPPGATPGVIAFSLHAPADQYAPRGSPAPRADRQALMLATAWVSPIHRERGLGRLLLHAAVREAVRLDRPLLQAYGDRRFRERACLLPATWLLHEGFVVHREHPRTPLFSLDVRRVARWAGSLEQALDEVLAHLPRPARVPSPSTPVRG